MRKIINVNNIPVIYEKFADTSGLFIMSVLFKRGSVHEPKELNGISHVLEHMCFRQTRDYTSEDISRLSEMYGGYLNAFTSKELTSFYIKGFSANLDLFTKLLANISFYPLFSEKDLEQEKKIIEDEINSTLDNPEEYLGEIAEEELFKGSPLEKTVAGSVDSVKSISLESLKEYYSYNYTPENCVITICGDVDEGEVCRCISEYFPISKEYNKSKNGYEAAYNHFNLNRQFKSEQVYAQMMYPAFKYSDERRYALGGASMILGGLMSSRLFQQIREKRGLCYNIESESVLYAGGGYMSINFSCTPENSEEVISLTKSEINKLLTDGITDEELVMIKNQLKYSYFSNFESLDSRVQMNFRHFYHYGELLDEKYILGLVDSLSVESVNSISNDLLNKEFSLCRLLP